MTETKKTGRPHGSGVDKHLPEIADLIWASGQKKTLTMALRELFPLGYKFDLYTREAALKRLRAKWKNEQTELLATAAQRASDKKLAAVKTKLDLLRMEEAHELLKLSKMEVSPISANSDMAITLFMPPATPESYDANPMVRALMSYGEYQQGYRRRYIEQKRKEQRKEVSRKAQSSL